MMYKIKLPEIFREMILYYVQSLCSRPRRVFSYWENDSDGYLMYLMIEENCDVDTCVLSSVYDRNYVVELCAMNNAL